MSDSSDNEESEEDDQSNDSNDSDSSSSSSGSSSSSDSDSTSDANNSNNSNNSSDSSDSSDSNDSSEELLELEIVDGHHHLWCVCTVEDVLGSDQAEGTVTEVAENPHTGELYYEVTFPDKDDDLRGHPNNELKHLFRAERITISNIYSSSEEEQIEGELIPIAPDQVQSKKLKVTKKEKPSKQVIAYQTRVANGQQHSFATKIVGAIPSNGAAKHKHYLSSIFITKLKKEVVSKEVHGILKVWPKVRECAGFYSPTSNVFPILHYLLLINSKLFQTTIKYFDLLGWLGWKCNSGDVGTNTKRVRSGVQRLATVCKSLKYLVESNQKYWEDVRMQVDNTVRVPLISTHVCRGNKKDAEQLLTCPTVDCDIGRSKLKKLPSNEINNGSGNTQVTLAHQVPIPIIIRGQPTTTSAKRLNGIYEGCDKTFDSNFSPRQKTTSVLLEKCERCGYVQHEEDESSGNYSLLYLSVYNAFLCVRCMNDAVALHESDHALLEATVAKIMKLPNVGTSTFAYSTIAIKSTFKKGSTSSKTLRLLAKESLNNPHTQSAIYVPARLAVDMAIKTEMKKRRTLKKNETVETTYTEPITIQALIQNSPHPVLGVSSTHFGWHTELALVPNKSKLATSPFVAVYAVSDQDSTETHLRAVVKIDPSKLFATFLTNFRKKVIQEKLEFEALSYHKQSKSARTKKIQEILKMFDELNGSDVAVYVEASGDVCNGKFLKATMERGGFSFESEVLFQVKIKTDAKKTKKRSIPSCHIYFNTNCVDD